MLRICSIVWAFMAVVVLAPLPAATIVVDIGGADYTDVQTAIDAATHGDTVLVKPGEYVVAEPITFRGKAITVKSEAGAEVTTIRMSEEPADQERASVVVFENGEGEASVLEGFTLTGGRGTTWGPGWWQSGGGGILCIRSSPTLTNCTISGNSGYGEGGGVYCGEHSSPNLTNCTISANSASCGGGVFCDEDSYPNLTNCIVWENSGGAWAMDHDSQPRVSFSCLEREAVFPGEGNINSNPLFCGFPGPTERFVDAASPEGGDGTAERPFRELAAALQFRLSLKENSPCLGSGKNGANMGADLGTCPAGEPTEPGLVHVAPGSYSVEGLTFSCGVSVVGAGADRTVLEGTVCGLRTGATLSGVTVTAGTMGGVVIGSGESPTLTNCTISGNSASWYGGGVYCGEDSSPNLTNCTISGNWAWEGGGVYCRFSSPNLTNCTISGNSASWGGGVGCGASSSPNVTNCIVWGNSGGSWVVDESSRARVTFSCLETQAVFPGEGNINRNPLFCGFAGPPERFVDAASPEGGDGTAERPFREFAAALQFRLSLKENSPCLGSGKNGANMGADLGTCAAGEPTYRALVHLAPGRYSVQGLTFSHGISIVGAGADRTVLEGTVWGLRTGATLSGVTVTGGTTGGVVIGSRESPSLTNCTISGNSAHEGGGVCCYRSSPNLTNCTISGNSAHEGGGVYSYRSSPNLTNCTISGNSAGEVGGVYCWENPSPNLTNCTISGNSAYGYGGGVYCYRSSPTLTNCTISGNSASWGGGVGCGAISSPNLTNCTISGNSASRGGGVGCGRNSSPTLTNCIVWGNSGGSLVVGESSRPRVSFSCLETQQAAFLAEGNIRSNPLFCGFAGPTERFVDAASPEGGDGTAERPFRELAAALQFRLSLKENSPCIGSGKNGANMGADLGTCPAGEPTEPGLVHVAPGRYSVEGLTFSHGISIVGAGADRTLLEGTVCGLRTGATLSNVTVTAGTRGGVVIGRGENPTLTNCTISGNSARWGGGVSCSSSSPDLTNCTISGNSAEHSGGGVYCRHHSYPTLTNCTISGNWASRVGGGVYCGENSSPNLTNCTISGNSASSGGGVDCGFSSPTLTNCIISGNSAEYGGGVYCSYCSPTLTNCTISGNWASRVGSGVYCGSNSSPTLTNCIVWGNQPESACGTLSHCLTDRDPMFADAGLFDFERFVTVQIGGIERQLPDFVVRAPDYHLQPGSPAIDTGTSVGAPKTDIEGNGRPCGAGIDIGAYESGDCQGPSELFRRGDANASGEFDLADPVALLSYLFGRGEPPGCLDAADVDDSGRLDIGDAVYSLHFLFGGGPEPAMPFPDCGMDPTIDELDCKMPGACP